MKHETTYDKRIREIYQEALESKHPQAEARRLLDVIGLAIGQPISKTSMPHIVIKGGGRVEPKS